MKKDIDIIQKLDFIALIAKGKRNWAFKINNPSYNYHSDRFRRRVRPTDEMKIQLVQFQEFKHLQRIAEIYEDINKELVESGREPLNNPFIAKGANYEEN